MSSEKMEKNNPEDGQTSGSSNTRLKHNAIAPKENNEKGENTPRYSNKRLMKNVIILSVGFMFNFTSFNGLSRLQSTLNLEAGMGVINQSILYGGLVLSCIVAPRFVINILGQKWTVCVCIGGYILWMVANGFPTWATLVPGSLIVGVCAAPLWAAQSSYLTKMGVKYAEVNDEAQQGIISRFFGIFFMFFQTANVIASVLSFTILSQEEAHSPNENETYENCGANECPWFVNNTNLKPPDDKIRWTLVGVFIASACIGLIIMAIFLDKLPKDLQDRTPMSELKQQAATLMKSTVMHLKHKKQLILIPITMYSGLEQAYFNAEFTRSFVACALGTHMVGLVILPSALMNAVTCVLCGWLVKYIGRVPIFITAWVVDIGNQLAMHLWSPHPNQLAVFFIMSTVWGFTEGIWQSQINGLYGSIFTKEPEAAFSNFRLWESLGFIIGFAYSNFICTNHKLYVLMVFLCLGNIGYLVVEWLERHDRTYSDEDEHMDIELNKPKPDDLKMKESLQNSSNTSLKKTVDIGLKPEHSFCSV